MHLGTRSLTLIVDGVYRTADVSDCRIASSTKEGVPRQVWQNGVRWLSEEHREYRLVATAAQDPAGGSLWDLVWSRAGEQVEVDLRPAGGTTPSEDQPWVVGTVTILKPDGDILGGPANPSTGGRFTFDIDWPFTAEPTLVRA